MHEAAQNCLQIWPSKPWGRHQRSLWGEGRWNEYASLGPHLRRHPAAQQTGLLLPSEVCIHFWNPASGSVSVQRSPFSTTLLVMFMKHRVKKCRQTLQKPPTECIRICLTHMLYGVCIQVDTLASSSDAFHTKTIQQDFPQSHLIHREWTNAGTCCADNALHELTHVWFIGCAVCTGSAYIKTPVMCINWPERQLNKLTETQHHVMSVTQWLVVWALKPAQDMSFGTLKCVSAQPDHMYILFIIIIGIGISAQPDHKHPLCECAKCL